MKPSTVQQLDALQKQVNAYLTLAQKKGLELPNDLLHLQTILLQRLDMSTFKNPVLRQLANAYNAAVRAWSGTHFPNLVNLRTTAPSTFNAQAFITIENAIQAIENAGAAFENAYNNETNQQDLTDYLTFYNGVHAKRNHATDSWLVILEDVKSLHWFKEFESYQHLHEGYKRAWKDRITPNMDAKLTDQQDVSTMSAIVGNYSNMFRLASTPPTNTRGIDVAHYVTTFNNNLWQDRQQTVINMQQTATNRQQATLTNGNPNIDPSSQNTSYQAPSKKAKLFKRGFFDGNAIHVNDVKQGDLDDCYVLAPLAALAKTRPETIRNMIRPQADGSFEVTLHLRTDPNSPNRTPTTITVKNEFPERPNGDPTYAKGGDGGETWVQVLEKAYAQAMRGYEYLNRGDEGEVLQVFTGQTPTKGSLDASQAATLQQTLLSGLENKAAITVASNTQPATINGVPMVPSHVYVVTRANDRGLKLYNPQGNNHLKLSWSDLYTHFNNYELLP